MDSKITATISIKIFYLTLYKLSYEIQESYSFNTRCWQFYHRTVVIKEWRDIA